MYFTTIKNKSKMMYAPVILSLLRWTLPGCNSWQVQGPWLLHAHGGAHMLTGSKPSLAFRWLKALGPHLQSPSASGLGVGECWWELLATQLNTGTHQSNKNGEEMITEVSLSSETTKKRNWEEGHIQRTKEDHHKKREKSGYINKTDTTIPLSLTKCIG